MTESAASPTGRPLADGAAGRPARGAWRVGRTVPVAVGRPLPGPVCAGGTGFVAARSASGPAGTARRVFSTFRWTTSPEGRPASRARTAACRDSPGAREPFACHSCFRSPLISGPVLFPGTPRGPAGHRWGRTRFRLTTATTTATALAPRPEVNAAVTAVAAAPSCPPMPALRSRPNRWTPGHRALAASSGAPDTGRHTRHVSRNRRKEPARPAVVGPGECGRASRVGAPCDR